MAGWKYSCCERLGLEAQRAIGQRAEAVVEVFVDGAGVDEMPVADLLAGFAVIGVEAHLDVRVREDAAKHRGVAVLGERLEFFGEIAVVAIRADGDAAADAGVEVARVAPPLLARVVLEEHLVELRCRPGRGSLPRSFSARRWGRAIAASVAAISSLVEGRPSDLLEGVEVDGELPVAAIGPREDFVFDRVPFGELAEVLADAVGIRAEIMRAVGVEEDAGGIVMIVGVAGDVVAAIDDQAACAALAGEPLGEHRPGEARADDEVINLLRHAGRRRGFPGECRASRCRSRRHPTHPRRSGGKSRNRSIPRSR